MKYSAYIRVGNERQLSKQRTAVVYIRTASSEGALEHSEEQLNLIKEFASLNNIKIKYIYKDLGVSGINRYYQKGLDNLLDVVKHNKIDFVLVTEPSRISRSINDYTAIETKLWRIGTHILPISNVKGLIQ